MKKIINLLLLTAIMQQVIAQTETFDIATYNPPKGWKRSTGQGYVIFQDGKQTGSTGSFCILVVYASRQSSGDADKDFKMEWADLVEKPNSITVTPETQKEQTPEDWTVVNGATKLKEGLHEYTCMLVSVTGHGKVMSVLVKVAGQDYLADIENFLTTMQLDATAAANNNTNNLQKDISLSADTETFDIATYKPPKDWKKDTKQGVVTYTITNTNTGGFCVIGIYAAKASEGTAEKDFAGEWNDLAVTPFAAEKNPKSETQTTADGWKAVAGTAPITFNGAAAYIVLTTFSGFGKTTSVIATLNDQAYIASIDSFLENLKLDKNAIVASVPANQNNQSGVVNSTSIVGTWSDQSHTLSSYVNSSGGYIGDASISSVTQYEFKADHTFTYSFLGISSSMTVRTEARGTYSINGNNLILKTTFYKSGYANDMKEDKTKETAETWQFYIGPNKWKAGPFLNLHKDGNYYMWSDYPYDYYNRIGAGNNLPLQNQENTNSGTSIAGIWSNSTKPIINAVISQAEFVGSNDTQTFEEYEFKADNTYVSKYFNRSTGGNLYYTQTTGTFKIDGRNLTLTPVKRRGGHIGGRGESFAIKNENDLRGAIKDESHLLGKPVTFDCFIGPTPWKDGPFLNLHKEGNYYINANFPYDYYNRLK